MKIATPWKITRRAVSAKIIYSEGEYAHKNRERRHILPTATAQKRYADLVSYSRYCVLGDHQSFTDASARGIMPLNN